MEFLNQFIFFSFGLIFGSFFNVVGLRVPNHNFMESKRSYCPQCQTELSWYELIPVLSFMIQRGKCRHCKGFIHPLYPVIELATGVLFLFSFRQFDITFNLIEAILIVSLAVIIVVTDVHYSLIPNRILGFFLPLFVLLRVITPLEPWWSSIAGGLIGFLLIFLVIVLSKGGMGAGDMKYFTVLGIVFGLVDVLLIFFLSTLYGAILNGMLLLLKKVNRKSKVPFGPYISLAAITVLFFSDHILNWYLSLF